MIFKDFLSWAVKNIDNPFVSLEDIFFNFLKNFFVEKCKKNYLEIHLDQKNSLLPFQLRKIAEKK